MNANDLVVKGTKVQFYCGHYNEITWILALMINRVSCNIMCECCLHQENIDRSKIANMIEILLKEKTIENLNVTKDYPENNFNIDYDNECFHFKCPANLMTTHAYKTILNETYIALKNKRNNECIKNFTFGLLIVGIATCVVNALFKK